MHFAALQLNSCYDHGIAPDVLIVFSNERFYVDRNSMDMSIEIEN